MVILNVGLLHLYQSRACWATKLKDVREQRDLPSEKGRSRWTFMKIPGFYDNPMCSPGWRLYSPITSRERVLY